MGKVKAGAKKPEQSEDEIFNKFVEAMQVAIRQLDNGSKAKITRKKMERRVSEGYSVSRPKLGYVKTDALGIHAPHTITATTLRCYMEDVLAGKITVAELRKKISHIYHKTKLLSLGRFKAIVLDPYYAGFVVFNGQVYKGLHEPLISQEEHEQLKKLVG